MAEPTGTYPTRSLFGIQIHALRMAEVLGECEHAIRTRTQLMLGVVNAAKIVNMRRDPLLFESVVGSDLVLADGMAVVWASRVLRQPLPERVAGIDLFVRLLELADQHGYSVYFLGAKQDVLDRVLDHVRKTYPGVRIAGSRNGYFGQEESAEVAAQIDSTRPDILFVAMSPPKKEIFLGEWGRRMDVAVCHGVGGSFDVIAGKVKRAPRFLQRLGLEWFYRMAQEPRRLAGRYFSTNMRFLWLVVREMVGGRRAKAPRVS